MSLPKLEAGTLVTLASEDGGNDISLLFKEGEYCVTAHCQDRHLQCKYENRVWTVEQAVDLFTDHLDRLPRDIREAFLGD